MNWSEVCQDKQLVDLPYKIELDKRGEIILSPATKKHSKLQIKLQRLFVRLLPLGDPLPECAVQTAEGTKVADVAWISEARWASMNPDEPTCSIAPEICVEILSAANTLEEMLGTSEKPGKRELYFRAGALEFWLCDQSGNLSFYDQTGQVRESGLCPGFPNKV